METAERLSAEKREKAALRRQLIKIAVPIAIQGVVSTTLGLVDDLMVGFLGEVELAAVGVGNQIFLIHYMLIYGMTSGTSTFVAQFYGANDKKNMRRCIGFSVTAMLAVSTLIFIIGTVFTRELLSFYTNDTQVLELAVVYMRTNSLQFIFIAYSVPVMMGFQASQQTKLPMLVSVVVFTTNTFLNYLFIYGKFGMPMLGVQGAALGTVIARLMQVLIVTGFLFSSNNMFKGPIRDYFDYNKELVRRIIKNATPTTANEVLWGVGQTMYAAAFNRIGTTAFAAFQAAGSISSIFFFAAFSVGDASLTLIGQRLGEGKKEEAWRTSKYVLKVGVLLGVLTGLVMMLLSKPFSELFNLSENGKHYTFLILIIQGVFMSLTLHNGIQITGTLRAGGDTRFAMLAESGCVWLVAVPLAFAAAMLWQLPIYFAVILVKMEEVVKFFVVFKRYISKKWMNVMIDNL